MSFATAWLLDRETSPEFRIALGKLCEILGHPEMAEVCREQEQAEPQKSTPAMKPRMAALAMKVFPFGCEMYWKYGWMNAQPLSCTL